MQRHGWPVIPVNTHGGQIPGEQAYRTLAELPGQPGLVDVFRPAVRPDAGGGGRTARRLGRRGHPRLLREE
jgi:hypothetical protein